MYSLVERNKKMIGGEKGMKVKKILVMIMVLALGMSLLSGCGKQETQEATAELGEENASTEGGMTIGFSIATLQYPYYVSMLEGFEKACKEKGWESIISDANLDAEKTINDCYDMILKGIDALVISSWYGDALLDVFEQCKKESIPVFLIDTGSAPDTGEFVTNIGTNNFDAGYYGGHWAAQYFTKNGKEEINFITFLNATTPARDRADGFLKGLEEGGLKVNVLNEYLGESRESYMASCEDALVTYPEIDLIYGTSAQASLGAYDACEGANRKDIKIIGFDCEDEERQLIDEGTNYIASIMQLPYEMAVATIQNIYDYINNGAIFEKQTPYKSGVYCVDGELMTDDIVSN
jgi:ribose transport system substrate-binding protein